MNIWFIAVFAITLLFWFWESLVDWLDTKRVDSLPTEVADVFDKNEYEKSQEYGRVKNRFGLISSTLQTVLFLVFFTSGGFGWLDLQVREFVTSTSFWPEFLLKYEMAQGIVFMGALLGASSLLGLPFQYYNTFVIEEKFGFNNTNLKTFIKDRVLGVVLGLVIGVPLLIAVLWLFGLATKDPLAWLYVWSAVFGFQMIMMYVAPVWIMPLFNKFETLEDGELKSAINDFATKENFALQGVFRMDGSKRSKKANAFFTGFGKNRRIVLFDTLIEKLSTEELVAVLAHEMGHFKKKHIFKQLIIGAVSMALTFFIIQVLLKNEGLFTAFGVKELSVYASLVFISPILTPLNYIIQIFSSSLSRKHEYEADAYAATSYRKPEKLISALKILSKESLSNLTPHSLKVFSEYSHPPLKDRIKALNKFAGKV
ncbi:MAG: M48 family metallopeptidase [Lentisphaeraceae bacterium]|nr:M48 family metallopeptidase [Lentisphaeraceae bacterium]